MYRKFADMWQFVCYRSCQTNTFDNVLVQAKASELNIQWTNHICWFSPLDFSRSTYAHDDDYMFLASFTKYVQKICRILESSWSNSWRICFRL